MLVVQRIVEWSVLWSANSYALGWWNVVFLCCVTLCHVVIQWLCVWTVCVGRITSNLEHNTVEIVIVFVNLQVQKLISIHLSLPLYCSFLILFGLLELLVGMKPWAWVGS